MTVSHTMTADIIVHSCYGTKRTFILHLQMLTKVFSLADIKTAFSGLYH